MKSYLSLIPISAKVRRRQNRLTILCIVISVFLVTAVFSMADMMIRGESETMQIKHGSWHIKLEQVSQDIVQQISARSDVKAAGWLAVINFNADQPYEIGGKKAALYGTDNTYITQLTDSLEEGAFPQSDDEIMLSSNAKLALDVQIGSRVTLNTPAGDFDFTVSGFGSDDKDYYQGQTYLTAGYMTNSAFEQLIQENGSEDCSPVCYIQFEDAAKASAAVSEIQKQYQLDDGCIIENTAVMGLAGYSSNQTVSSFYMIAAVLFILVILAGVLMISGSMNSNVAQRTKFFGMLRCIGASRKQIMQFVRLEALNWCKTAVPAGLLLGTVISWGVCAFLHYCIGGEFEHMPLFGISLAGLVSGAAAGCVTVLLAAQSPAKRAAKVSPAAAVSGNSQTLPVVRQTLKNRRGRIKRIERTLGVYHATASKKNWFLMTASFSLSIILFLCFSVGMDFAHNLLPSLRSWQPDITLNGYANARVLEQHIIDEISAIQGVKQVFGCSYIDNTPAVSSRQGVDHVSIVSYSDVLLGAAKESVTEGDISEIYGKSSKVMTISNKDNPLKTGDTVRIGENETEIVCALSSGVYPSECSIICSQETFTWLTGEENYSMIGVQLGNDADDETLQQISSFAGSDVIYTDFREKNKEDVSTYLATRVIMYSFLGIIAMITVFNIINSISMSVNARIRQYGAMRAVGMDGRQLARMIAFEAFTYAVCGIVTGCAVGIVLSRLLYSMLITKYFGTVWSFPVLLIVIIILFGFISAAAAVYAPAKRICSMAVTETISEL